MDAHEELMEVRALGSDTVGYGTRMKYVHDHGLTGPNGPMDIEPALLRVASDDSVEEHGESSQGADLVGVLAELPGGDQRRVRGSGSFAHADVAHVLVPDELRMRNRRPAALRAAKREKPADPHCRGAAGSSREPDGSLKLGSGSSRITVLSRVIDPD